jgi:hypothetical protein
MVSGQRGVAVGKHKPTSRRHNHCETGVDKAQKKNHHP